MIFSPDKNGNVDGPTAIILDAIDGLDMPFIPMNMFSNYEFNPELNKLGKWILFDYAEYGANSFDRTDTHIWGVNSYKFKQANGAEWKKFDEFVREHPPLVYFKRELLKKDVKNNIYPIEYPCFQPEYPVSTREEFNCRPIELFFNWGHSHESRRVLHGNIFLNAARKGYGVVDSFTNFNESFRDYKKVWATIYTPYWARIDMPTVLFIQGQSKLSVSLPGAGVKCFRSAEAPINSIMVMEDDNLAWSYEWEHGVNCIKFPSSKDFEEIRGLKNQWKVIDAIEEALQREDLYDIYLRGIETCNKYRLKNYIQHYIKPLIQKHDS